jgi:EmrB/QacA subfamily drug resistance transporter
MDEPASNQGPPTPAELPGRSRWWVLVAVGVGTFMSALDGSVVNTMLPVLSRAFHSDVAGVEWVVTVYLLVVSSLLLTFGRLGDLKGHKPVYMAGFVVFVVGSALCGASPSLGLLAGFRGLQAIGAATIFANGPAILTTHFPARERGRALGLAATMTYLGLTAGPSLGGWLAEAISWRAAFYINVPVGLVGLALSLRFIPKAHPAEQPGPFDWRGASLFMVGLTALLLSLDQGHAWGWASWQTLGAMAIAGVFLVAFVAFEQRIASPMLDLRLFGDRTFSAATTSAVLNYIAVAGVLFLLPFYLIQGRGFTPAHAGLILTAQPLVMAIVAPVSGAVSDRMGTRAPAVLGMLVLAGGVFALSRLPADASLLALSAELAMVGLGTGMFISPNNSALMGAAPRAAQGVAGGILAAARNVGLVFGVGLAGAVFNTVLGAQGTHAPLAAIAQAAHAGYLALAAIALAGSLTSALR